MGESLIVTPRIAKGRTAAAFFLGIVVGAALCVTGWRVHNLVAHSTGGKTRGNVPAAGATEDVAVTAGTIERQTHLRDFDRERLKEEKQLPEKKTSAQVSAEQLSAQREKEIAQVFDALYESRKRHLDLLEWVMGRDPGGEFGLARNDDDEVEENMIANDMNLSAGMAKYLGATASEQERLRDLLLRTLQSVQRLQAERAVVESVGEKSVTLQIPAAPPPHGQVEQDLNDNIVEILGPTRGEVFGCLAMDRIRYLLYNFGETARALEFECVEKGDGTPGTCRIVDRHGTPDCFEHRENTVSAIPNTYAAFGTFLPAAVRKFMPPGAGR